MDETSERQSVKTPTATLDFLASMHYGGDSLGSRALNTKLFIVSWPWRLCKACVRRHVFSDCSVCGFNLHSHIRLAGIDHHVDAHFHGIVPGSRCTVRHFVVVESPSQCGDVREDRSTTIWP